MRNLVTVLTAFSLPLAVVPAVAAEPVPPGSTATIGIRLTARDQVKSDWRSAVTEHVFNGQCLMQAAPASSVGPDGMTPEQEAKAAAMQSQAAAVQQEFAPSDDMMAQIAAGAEACGDDEAC